MNKSVTVVYSTRQKDEDYVKHLKKMFGNPNTEILTYINNGEYSLTELYNKGLNESSNNIVLFVHDDLIFETKNMCDKVIKLFKNNPEFGIIGVAGTTDLINGRWWDIKESSIGKINHMVDGKKWASQFSKELYPDKPKEVVAIDGVVIMVDKTKIKEKFDEDFNGFHFYDISFCVANYIRGVKIGVTTKFNLTHKSVGNANEDWEKNRVLLMEKYNGILPIRLTKNKTYDEKLNYSPDDVGIGIIGDNLSDVILIESQLPKKFKNIKFRLGNNVSENKNSLIKELLKLNCEHIFILDKDIIIKDNNVFDVYVTTAVKTGTRRLSFGGCSQLNMKDGIITPKHTIEYPDGLKIDFYNDSSSSFIYFNKTIFEYDMFYDEKMNKEVHELEHTYRTSTKGLIVPFWWFTDITDSNNYLDSKKIVDVNNDKNGMEYFKRKYGYYLTQIKVCEFSVVNNSLSFFLNNR